MINTNTLTAYVDEHKLPLIKKAVLSAKTAEIINLQTGVKHAAALNLLNTEVVFGDGSACGWDEAGTSNLTQRTLEVGHIKVNMSFCDRQLLDYWTGYEVKVAAGKETLPFEEAFVASVIEAIGAKVEKLIWQGSKKNGDAFDGFAQVLQGTGAITPELTGSTLTEKIYEVYTKIPMEVIHKAAIFVGEDTFIQYVGELNSANLYHYDPKVDEEMSITIPGTNTKIYGVSGLNGTSGIFAADPKNLYFGTDLADDEEVFDLWYSKDNQEFRLAIKFNAGVQVAFPNQVVATSLA